VSSSLAEACERSTDIEAKVGSWADSDRAVLEELSGREADAIAVSAALDGLQSTLAGRIGAAELESKAWGLQGEDVRAKLAATVDGSAAQESLVRGQAVELGGMSEAFRTQMAEGQAVAAQARGQVAELSHTTRSTALPVTPPTPPPPPPPPPPPTPPPPPPPLPLLSFFLFFFFFFLFPHTGEDHAGRYYRNLICLFSFLIFFLSLSTYRRGPCRALLPQSCRLRQSVAGLQKVDGY